MATRKKASPQKKQEKQEPAPPQITPVQPAAAPAPDEPEGNPYEEYQAAPVPDRVEVRINGKIVFMDSLHNAKVETLSGGTVKVNGTSEPPKSATKKNAPEQHIYDPTRDEGAGPNVATATTPTTVPVPDPEYTEALDESATPDNDGE